MAIVPMETRLKRARNYLINNFPERKPCLMPEEKYKSFIFLQDLLWLNSNIDIKIFYQVEEFTDKKGKTEKKGLFRYFNMVTDKE